MPVEPIDGDSTERLSVWYDAAPAEEPEEADPHRLARRVELAAFVTLVGLTIGVVIWLALN